MPRIVLKTKILKWGNSYGFRVAKADFERAGLQVGQELEVDVLGRPGKVDVSHIATFHSGDPNGSRDHDEILYEAQLEKMLKRRSISKAEFDREFAASRARREARNVGR